MDFFNIEMGSELMATKEKWGLPHINTMWAFSYIMNSKSNRAFLKDVKCEVQNKPNPIK